MKVTCPKCGSDQISANKKGFSGKKAVAGALVVGGIGLFAGTLGSKKILCTCLACGNTFKAGEGKIVYEAGEIPRDKWGWEIKTSTKLSQEERIAKRALDQEEFEKHLKKHPVLKVVYTLVGLIFFILIIIIIISLSLSR